MLVDELGGVSLYDIVKLATGVTYLPYRHGDRFFLSANKYGHLGKRIGRGVEDYKNRPNHKLMFAALDYAYKYCHIVVGNYDEREYFERALFGALDNGKLAEYWLNLDNHDSFVIHSEDGKYYYLLFGDGDYYLFDVVGTPNIKGYIEDHPIYGYLKTVTRLPRISQ